jgi:DNA-binding beta-propeller fold protein YncE
VRKDLKVVCLATVASLSCLSALKAAELKLIGTIPVPGKPLTSFDIAYVDQASERLVFANRSNGTVDVFDTKTDKLIGQVAGLVGPVLGPTGTVNNNKSGPDGVLAFADEVWAGDGDSTVKVIDLKTMKIVDTISTGGTTRLDEMAYDPVDQIFIGVNNAETPPYATLISTKPGHKVLAKIMLPDATGGAEQPGHNAADGMFYVALPELKMQVATGGVAVIDPLAGTLVKTLPVQNCRPNGLMFGPDQNFVLGCTANGGANGLPPLIVIMNAKTGAVVANVAGIGGADMVGYSAKNGQFYSGSANQPGGPVLGVIDAKTNALVQKIPTGAGASKVAADETNGHVYVPVGSANGGCSCIQVYAP